MRLAIARTGFLVASMLMAGLAQPAEPSAIASSIDFQTTGTVGSTGVTGAPVLRFEGRDDSLTTGSTFDLGRFVVSPSPDGRSTTYKDTPFDVTFAARAVDGISTPDAAKVSLHGWLEGTITGNDASKLRAIMSVDSHLDLGAPPSFAGPFRAGNLLNYLSPVPSPAGGPLPSASGNSVALQSVVHSTEVVPEPGTLALFACLAAASACRGFRR
jgi:hypothetical protein